MNKIFHLHLCILLVCGIAIHFKSSAGAVSSLTSLQGIIISQNITCACLKSGGGGGLVLPKKLGRGVRPASQNSYPIYD